MVKQQAYILFACLVIIACLMLLCLGMAEQLHMQKRLINISWSADQAYAKQLSALQIFFDHLEIEEGACKLTWLQADQAFVGLEKASIPFCLQRVNATEIRYVIVTDSAQRSFEVDAVYRLSSEDTWHYAQKDLA
ncbi:MAG: hypothetical protein K0S08_1889 [Gammaproteobacteria bacterium]|jgi:hypothetical protein|nr:hypothetical protein [Gammaproteobacteria bacterium]